MEEALDQYNAELANGTTPAPKAPAVTGLTSLSKEDTINVLSGCLGTVGKTYQGFGGLKEIENLHKVTSNTPIQLRNKEGTKMFQGTFCHSGYWMNSEAKKYPNRISSNPGVCTWRSEI
jgi:hypothetical protein